MARKFILFVLLLLLVLQVKANESCITSQCHTAFNRLKHIHFPAQDNCTTCHETKVDVSQHRFTLANQTDVCFQCHDENRKHKYVHEAINTSGCVGCHNPHGGDYKDYLIAGRIDAVCFECHDKEPLSKKEQHTPVRSGECTSCHRAHSSDNPALLVAKKEGFCIGCHKDKDYSKGTLKIHSVVPNGCSRCHNPHSTDFRFQLSAEPGDICGKCHEEFITKVRALTVPHPTLEREKKCLNCHNAHASKENNILRMSEIALCLDCHKVPLNDSVGRKGYNVNNVMKNNPVKHGPLAEGMCSECHSPHGSDFFRILKDAYPKNFYRQYTADSYRLCFSCHDISLVTQKETASATNFRDGTRNLHFVHVNLKKGRTCRACHEVHAAQSEQLIRMEAPFGKWDIPLNFKKVENGGSCSPGCHVQYEYNRRKK